MRALVFLVAASAATGCHGRAKSASEWSSKKAAYQPGAVVRHAPDGCAGGHLFVDLRAAEKNEATRVAVDVLGTRLFGGSTTSKTGRALEAMRRALADEGLDVARDTHEIAICSRGGEAGLVALLGGDFSGKDLFRGVERAAQSLGDREPRIEERNGVEFMRLGRVAIARVSGNVVALGEDVDTLTSLGAEKDRSTLYGYVPGIVAAAQIGGDLRVRIGDDAPNVFVEISLRTNKSAADLESRRSGVVTRLEETPLRTLSPLAANAQIRVSAGFAVLELRGRATDVANGLQTAAELSPNELKKILGYVFGGADGSGTPEHKI